MTTRVWTGTIISVIAFAVGSPAYGELACPESRNNDEARIYARENFAAAQETYEQGRPLRALEHYQCSYRHVAHPDTLYNIGVLSEGIGQLQIARDAYQEYLERFPDGGAAEEIRNRLRDVEGRIPSEPTQPTQSEPSEPQVPLQPIQFQPQPQTLQPLVAEPPPQVEQPSPQVQQPEPQPQPQPRPQRRRRSGGRIAAIATLPTGLIMTATGGFLYMAAVLRNDDFQLSIENRIVSRSYLQSEAEYGRSLEVAGFVMMGLGAATVVASIVFFAIFPRYRPETSTASRGRWSASLIPYFSGDGSMGLGLSGLF